MMRRRVDRLVIAIACALAGGGWVCEGDASNRCPGALTCDIDVANVCCPLGSAEWCDGSCTNSCPGNAVQCNDEAHILDCAFNATIDSATCGNPRSTPQGVIYTLEVSGTLSGCGQEAAMFTSTTAEQADLDCGDWDSGVYGGCIPTSPDITSTSWRFTQSVPGGSGGTFVLTTLLIKRAHGSAPPLAMMSVKCGPP
jgi:hypothetical protein